MGGQEGKLQEFSGQWKALSTSSNRIAGSFIVDTRPQPSWVFPESRAWAGPVLGAASLGS